MNTCINCSNKELLFGENESILIKGVKYVICPRCGMLMVKINDILIPAITSEEVTPEMVSVLIADTNNSFAKNEVQEDMIKRFILAYPTQINELCEKVKMIFDKYSNKEKELERKKEIEVREASNKQNEEGYVAVFSNNPAISNTDLKELIKQVNNFMRDTNVDETPRIFKVKKEIQLNKRTIYTL